MLNLSKRIYLTEGLTKKSNLVGMFGKEDLCAIGEFVHGGYTRDKASRFKWEKRTDAALNLALQVVKTKNFPWPQCSNIAFPLITIAAMQFHSTSYPAIFQGADLVKYRIAGSDPDGSVKARGDLISDHMSYQLSYEDQAWEEQHDRLLLTIPIVGCAFMKTYHSAADRQNRSELVMAHDLVMDYYAKSVESAQRKTHEFPIFRNDMYERCKTGVYTDVTKDDWFAQEAPVETDKHTAEENQRTGQTNPQPDEDTPFKGLECHCYLDLDGDGYKEPYVVTVEKHSKTVLRIVTRFEWQDVDMLSNGTIYRIRPTEYFTKYGFIPSADGSVYDLGFGVLLGPLNEASNGLINQLVDAGTMANAGGGFLARGAKMRGGQYAMSPLEWRPVDVSGDDLKKSIMPLPVREPSMVLFQLLALLINYTGRIAGTTDTMVGENPGQNTPAQTTQTLIDQGMKVHRAIFKRVWRSMKEELAKLYIQNSYYLSPLPMEFGDKGQKIQRVDYLKAPPNNIMPASDPNVVSETVRFQIATAVKVSASQTPGYNRDEVERNWLKAQHVDSIDVLFPGSDKVPVGKDLKLQIEELRLQAKGAELQFQQQKFVAELMEERRVNQAKITELMAKASLEMEQAGGIKEGHQIALFEAAIGALKAHNDNITTHLDLLMRGIENEQARQDAGGGGVSTLANTSNNGGTAQSGSSAMGG